MKARMVWSHMVSMGEGVFKRGVLRKFEAG